MKKKVLVFAHGDDPFLEEIMFCLEGLDIEVHPENQCPMEVNITYDWEPDAVILSATSLERDKCMQHIKTLSKDTVVLIADRDSTVERYIHMQVLGVKDYFHVPLDRENMRNAVIDLLKIK